MLDTKQKILDTAERLFGEQGYGATSLRQVIVEAEVNVAAVHYHFGSKEDLLDAVVSRKAVPLTEARHARLDRAEQEAGEDVPDIERILESFLLPTAELAHRNPLFARFMGRMLTEGMMPRIVERHFRESAARFVAALKRSAPHLDHAELHWRVHFMIGAMAHTMSAYPLLCPSERSTDYPTRMRRLIRFLAAGFRAPGEQQANKE